MTTDNLFTLPDGDNGIEWAEFEEIKRDTVIVPRDKYEHLLWLTTPKPIESAPMEGEEIFVSNDGKNWIQSYFVGEQGWMYAETLLVTLWLPLPNTPLPTTASPKLEDAPDPMGR